MTRKIEKGTVKVVWIGEDDMLYSKMFDTPEDALIFSKDKKDYLITKLVSEKDMEDFVWEVLPFGHHKIYFKLLKLYRSGLLSKFIE